MNFKKIFLIIFCLLIFNSCTSKQKTHYQNEEWGFSFKYPKNWVLNEKSFRISIQDSKKEMKANFVVMPKKLPSESKITSEQFFKQMSISANPAGKNGKTNINGVTAYWVQFSLKNPSTKEAGMFNKVYLVVNEKVAYQIQYSIMPNSPNKYKKITENIVKSFKFN